MRSIPLEKSIVNIIYISVPRFDYANNILNYTILVKYNRNICDDDRSYSKSDFIIGYFRALVVPLLKLCLWEVVRTVSPASSSKRCSVCFFIYLLREVSFSFLIYIYISLLPPHTVLFIFHPLPLSLTYSMCVNHFQLT